MSRPTDLGYKTQGSNGLAADNSVRDNDSPDMNVKQLAQTVRYGRKITFKIAGSEDIIGYLSGMDSEYFYVLSPVHEGFERWMVARSGNPAFRMHEQSTYDDEPQREQMDQIIAPFRSAMTNKVRRRSDTPRKVS